MSRPLAARVGVAVCCTGLCAAAPAGAPGGERFRFACDHGSGEPRAYEALIERPEAGTDTGSSVLLIGGGYGWDLHWTVPGSYELDGETTVLTLDGEPTRDADTLAAALVGSGFTVLRWSTVYVGDPLYKGNAAFMTPVPIVESFELTREAIGAFRARGGFEPGRLFLLGHSLGAARAGVVAEADDAAGFVLLAGAYVSPTRARPRELSEAALGRHGDADGDGVVGEGEFGVPGEAFGGIDRDGDGVLRGWELAAWDRSRGEIAIDDDRAEWVDGERWPSAGLIGLDRPVLALYGGLDPTSVHGPWLEAAGADGRLGDCTVRYFAGLGHQLGAERDGRTGPIDPAVVSAVVEWLRAHVGR